MDASMLMNLNGPWSNPACMGYCLMAMQQAGVPEPMQALALGYAKGLADAAQLHQTSPAQPGKSA